MERSSREINRNQKNTINKERQIESSVEFPRLAKDISRDGKVVEVTHDTRHSHTRTSAHDVARPMDRTRDAYQAGFLPAGKFVNGPWGVPQPGRIHPPSDVSPSTTRPSFSRASQTRFTAPKEMRRRELE